MTKFKYDFSFSNFFLCYIFTIFFTVFSISNICFKIICPQYLKKKYYPSFQIEN